MEKRMNFNSIAEFVEYLNRLPCYVGPEKPSISEASYALEVSPASR